MNTKLTAKKTVSIDAPVSKVWEALTTPELIKEYFYGTEAVSDWKVGSPIIFRGVWEGSSYEDKGTILESKPYKFFKYNYWSSLSGTEDIADNYADVTYELSPEGNSTILTVTQEGILSEEKKQHSEDGWGAVLNNMKDLVENKKTEGRGSLDNHI